MTRAPKDNEEQAMKSHSRIEFLIVGEEILRDPGRDTNSRHMADALAREGFDLAGISVVGDREEDIVRALRSAAGRADAVLVTGGLGPTSDDLTIPSAAQAFGLPLELDEPSLADIEAFFRRRGWPMTESNRKQAMLPRGAVSLPNPVGTAPGVCIETGGTMFFFMPGVPAEMAGMLQREVLPRLRERFVPARITTASLKVTGIGESALFDRIRDIPGVLETGRFYPNPGGITIRLVAGEDSGFDAASIAGAVRNELGPLVYGDGEQKLEQVVAALLTKRGLTIAAAESCTGGLVADRLTDVPGSSAYVLLGVVAYANEAKERVLGIPGGLIREHGAVSGPVAAAMAEGVRSLAGADIGIATTGIAGPGGATPGKPLGLMFQSLSHAGGTITKKLQFGEERRINKERMSQSVLDMVRAHLEGRT
jgi:nicotinamide-nucleotide amidase